MTASASFLVPYERLRSDENRMRHPSGDRERFKNLADRLDELTAEKFCGSKLCPSLDNSWKVAKGVPRVDGDLDSWFPPQSLKPFSKDKKVSSTLTLIRNALAHGNLFTTGNPIENLIFVTGTGENFDSSYEVLSVRPEDFYIFICSWVDSLSPFQDLYLAA